MTARAFSILDAARDERLFGKALRDLSTWRAWFVFLAGLFALPMSEAEAEVWRACTGRSVAPPQPFREAWLVCGRRSGKSFVMALVSVYLACFRDYRAYLGPGEKATLMVVAADRRQARQVMRFVRDLLSASVLAKRVVNDTADSIELAGDAVIEVITASNAVRGYTVAGCCCDELAFWPTEDSATPDQAIIEAIRPAMLTIPNSLLICASSPYARRGALWDAYRKHYGKDDAPVLVWRAPTLTMSSTTSIPRISLEGFTKDGRGPRVKLMLTDAVPPNASMHRPHQVGVVDSAERRMAEDAYQARNDFLGDAWRSKDNPPPPPLRDGQSPRDAYIEHLTSAWRTPPARNAPVDEVEALQRRWASSGATPGPGRRPTQDAAASRAEADQAYAQYCARLQGAWKTR